MATIPPSHMTITVNGRPVSAKRGELLATVLIRAGIPHPHPCGGTGQCGKCTVTVDGEPRLSCQYRLTHAVDVRVAEEANIAISPLAAERMDDAPATALALDIGTTTIALATLSPREHKMLRTLTFNNPQRRFGADVISRIDYAMAHDVLEMATPLRDAISAQIATLLSPGQASFDVMHVAGNTTMLHILLGIDPSPMGTAPYTPFFLDEKRLPAAAYGIRGVRELHLLPSISAFVGADLVAGLCLVGRPTAQYRLLLDLGTNAEILFIGKDKILATAAAAGPCFEGASIACGMSATAGAISAYSERGLETIGHTPPVGICGTGLVDVIAYLRRHEIIDETGYMAKDFPLCTGVRLTPGDVRQYQLAKAAVCAAILTLMQKAGIDFTAIERVCVAGGFSAKLSIENAAATGLIPRELQDRCTDLGNSSLAGTIKAACTGCDLASLIRGAEYIDLSADATFSAHFIANMGFRP